MAHLQDVAWRQKNPAARSKTERRGRNREEAELGRMCPGIIKNAMKPAILRQDRFLPSRQSSWERDERF
jgi:hypothetical protein